MVEGELYNRRQQQRERVAGLKKESTGTGREAADPPRAGKGAKKRKGGAKEEAELLAALEALVKDGQSVRGRDASVIRAEAEELAVALDEGWLSPSGKKKVVEHLEEIRSADAFEQGSGKVVKYLMLICTFLPMLLTQIGNVEEWATRPTMAVSSADLSGMRVVVTGGCGALGFELATMLAQSGAGVVLGCRPEASEEGSATLDRIRQLDLLRGDDDSDALEARGWIEPWPLSLDSFASVRAFAGRVDVSRRASNPPSSSAVARSSCTAPLTPCKPPALAPWGQPALGVPPLLDATVAPPPCWPQGLDALNLLVHGAATKRGCNRSEDGHEHATQVNYLSPFMLTSLLLPSLRRASASRVVVLACDAGLQVADYLPWPLARTRPDQLPSLQKAALERSAEGAEPRCSEALAYANSKLALVAYAAELNRRLGKTMGTRSAAHAVNPGAMLGDFHAHAPPAPSGGSMRATMMGYFPPVWLARQAYRLVFSRLGDAMLRTPAHGAKAAFHVATSPALATSGSGGFVFSDAAGAFIDCGKAAQVCGRVAAASLPAEATDPKRGASLWERTERAIGPEALRPLGDTAAPAAHDADDEFEDW